MSEQSFWFFHCPDDPSSKYSYKELRALHRIAEELKGSLSITLQEHSVEYLKECETRKEPPSEVYIYELQGDFTVKDLRRKLREHEVAVSPPGVIDRDSLSGEPVIDYE